MCVCVCVYIYIYIHTYPFSYSFALWFITGYWIWASLVPSMVKNLSGIQETWVQSLGQEDPWRRKWQPTPVFLPGESHGQRSQAGCSPWGHKEWDMTEWLTISIEYSSLCYTVEPCWLSTLYIVICMWNCLSFWDDGNAESAVSISPCSVSCVLSITSQPLP